VSTTPTTRRNVVRAVFLAVLVALAVAKWVQNERQAAAQQLAAQQSQKRALELQRQYDATRAWLRERTYPDNWKLADLQSHLPDKPTLQLTPASSAGQRESTWRNPASGASWRFKFDDQDRVVGWSVSGGPAPKITVPPSDSFLWGDRFRWIVITYAPWLWWVAFVALLVVGKRWPWLADVMLLLALACLAAQALNPLYTLSFLFWNDAAYWGGLMVALSLAALAATTPRYNSLNGWWLLPRQFTVRWLLGVTALVGLLITLRAPGLILGSLVVVTALSYAVFRRRFADKRPSPLVGEGQRWREANAG
jgi:hypothetical protein